MIRRFNYTDRKTIHQKSVRIRIRDDQTFEASWDLSEYEISAGGLVYIEAVSSGSYQILRFPYGTVGTPDPAASDRRLGPLAGRNLSFTFKVVDQSSRLGRLLGAAMSIRPLSKGDEESGQQSLLPFNPADLGQQVWRLSFANNRPWLEANSRIPGIMDMVREDYRFFALVYPAVVRQVLERVLFVEEMDDVDGNAGDWRVQWLRWAVHWHPDNARPPKLEDNGGPDPQFEWIEEVVNGFCDRRQTRDLLVGALGDGGGA